MYVVVADATLRRTYPCKNETRQRVRCAPDGIASSRTLPYIYSVLVFQRLTDVVSEKGEGSKALVFTCTSQPLDLKIVGGRSTVRNWHCAHRRP